MVEAWLQHKPSCSPRTYEVSQWSSTSVEEIPQWRPSSLAAQWEQGYCHPFEYSNIVELRATSLLAHVLLECEFGGFTASLISSTKGALLNCRFPSAHTVLASDATEILRSGVSKQAPTCQSINFPHGQPVCLRTLCWDNSFFTRNVAHLKRKLKERNYPEANMEDSEKGDRKSVV